MTARAIKYVSFHEESGYGVAARRTIAGLRAAGVEVSWAPLVFGKGWGRGYEPLLKRSAGDPELDPICNVPIDPDVVIAHTTPEFFPFIRAQNPGKPLIGSTVWETSGVPRAWPSVLAVPDRLIVPCTWNRDVFQRCGVTVPIDVVAHPLGDDPPAAPWAPPGVRPDDFVFYTIGVWNERKAVDLTVKAFLNAFTADDPVVLVVKTSPEDFTQLVLPDLRGGTAATIARLRRKHRRPARVVLVTEVLDRPRLLGLHARGDCFVSLCRSEGWGLGAFEAAAAGKPVIITGYGGQLDFLPPGYDLLVDYVRVPVIHFKSWRSYSPDQLWARPSLRHGAKLMRRVFADPAAARRRGEQLAPYVHARFGKDRVAAQVIESATAAAASHRAFAA